MPRRETKTLNLTPEQADFVAACIESGRYQTASDVVHEALRLLEVREARESSLSRARQLIEEGTRQLDAGETIDGDEFFAEWECKHSALINRESEEAASKIATGMAQARAGHFVDGEEVLEDLLERIDDHRNADGEHDPCGPDPSAGESII